MQMITRTVLDQAAIEEIRKAVVCWYDCEEGAPAIHPSSPMTELAGETFIDYLEAFLLACVPVVGRFTFPNPLKGLGPYSKYDHGIPPAYFDGDDLRDEIEVEITRDHLILLAHLSACDWTPADRPAFDPKRVFNDYRDAAVGAYVAINGDQSEDFELHGSEREKYTKLWHETAATLQVQIREAEVTPGIYSKSIFGQFVMVGDTRFYALYKAIMKRNGTGSSRSHYFEKLAEIDSHATQRG